MRSILQNLPLADLYFLTPIAALPPCPAASSACPAELHPPSHPVSAVLPPAPPPADSDWAEQWPFQFEALYTVCLMAPDPPTLSDLGKQGGREGEFLTGCSWAA